MVWDLMGGSSKDGTQVRYFSPTSRELQLNRVAFQVILYKYEPSVAGRIWKLHPVNVED